MVRNERRDFCYFRHVLGLHATYRVSKSAKIVVENHLSGQESGVAQRGLASHWCPMPERYADVPLVKGEAAKSRATQDRASSRSVPGPIYRRPEIRIAQSA